MAITGASTMPEQRIATANEALTPRQDVFVDAFVGNGGDARAAAQAAGYTSRRLDHRVDDLLRQPVVTAEIARRTTQLLARLGPKAVATLQRLVGQARSEYVQLQAAQDLLDRLGMRAPERQEHTVTGDLKVVIDLSTGETPPGRLLDADTSTDQGG
jgi:phage terminase small subunit